MKGLAGLFLFLIIGAMFIGAIALIVCGAVLVIIGAIAYFSLYFEADSKQWPKMLAATVTPFMLALVFGLIGYATGLGQIASTYWSTSIVNSQDGAVLWLVSIIPFGIAALIACMITIYGGFFWASIVAKSESDRGTIAWFTIPPGLCGLFIVSAFFV